MKTVCSFCAAVIHDDYAGDGQVSHGVCPSCFAEITKKYGFNVRKFLDLLDAPVMLVDNDARVLAANHLAASLTGKAVSPTNGQFCGDVLACINAILEGGCGKTKSCPDCVFRKSVTETYTTGLPVTDRPAPLCRRNGSGKEKISMLVSTRKDGDAVLLRLRPVPVS